MDSQSQLLKGILEGCILSIIAEDEVYGYELSQKLHEAGLTMVREGSIYPVLLRIQKGGLIIGRMKPSSSGPDRKYYSLTEKGQEALAAFEASWDQLVESMELLRRKQNERRTNGSPK
ncbi:PadR family transcriptional regulator [Paenibacillus eucommiae]|uniref:PadR family transcriptional regulator PadR n=1 Tax=Paenibacillus eucommiae TaxID=1355755 RepID=A0ABS4J7Z1_9BACL|nr:PadR family transcriptional regulator [Paenibacillus eucommiae]MBP1995964.1 PadR family transcriptional regulator PadR [Paenibacillus eucommiae]